MDDLSSRATDKQVTRSYTFGEFELRAGKADSVTLEGHASITAHPYEVNDMWGAFTETIKPGAFKKTLSESPDVMLLVNHGGLPLARTKSGTLRLAEDGQGLAVSATLEPTDPDVQAIVPKMERGDLNEMSFAFRVVRDQWNEDYTERDIAEVNLHKGDVSVVNYGANPATSAALRGLAELVGADLGVLDDEIRKLRAGQEADLAVIERARRALDELLAPAAAPIEVLDLYKRCIDRRF